MLVVICAIRKLMECVFHKRELRLLDDLLPESGKSRRVLRKMSTRRKDWDDDNIKNNLKAEQELAKAKLRKKAKELGLELEAISKYEPEKGGKANKLSVSFAGKGGGRYESQYFALSFDIFCHFYL